MLVTDRLIINRLADDSRYEFNYATPRLRPPLSNNIYDIIRDQRQGINPLYSDFSIKDVLNNLDKPTPPTAPPPSIDCVNTGESIGRILQSVLEFNSFPRLDSASLRMGIARAVSIQHSIRYCLRVSLFSSRSKAHCPSTDKI